ncbi:hypothetical protein ES319_D06G227300v1 [Gossypium barbadense]|uniref:Uncharacterized protein n=2 Tax=Gossypium TaxID=3633 RepID=A0A5J5R4Y9_GOSBA|nr:hypothetical protein ES319_D06G227300v1 [Gossypium barbadense]TYG66095.1 hypothetical protein ES288_D06G240000v1 [Gossypium darwinii]
MLQEISDHKSKGAFEKVVEDPPAASVVVRPVEQPVGLESTIQTLWSCIEDKDVGIIGLCGMGGVGKTTLLTKLKNMFSTPQSDFKVVIWAVVSAYYDVGKIQDRIGEHIGFPRSWENKSVEQKARDIYGILSTKRFVVLLDDIWGEVDFNEFGIPEPSQENGSKLIFTSRMRPVCVAMGAKTFNVQPLELEKAWELFQDKVGDEALNSHPDIPNLAEQLAERCGGLPLALVTIGRAMACKTTLGEWNYAIETLKRHDGPLQLQNEAFRLLKFSYDNLPNATMRACFLYCCLYPEDYSIPKKRLVEYWFCEGLLNEYDRVSDAQMQSNDIISSLLNACLLENGGEIHGEECVKMHDVIRDMALCIADNSEAKENNFFVKAGAQLYEEPDVKAGESVKRMSLMANKIKVLKETPKCPNLRTLFLSQNELQVISDGFFQLMPHLTVLDLSRNLRLRVLPEGISQLVCLQCLDLSYTGISELRMGLKSLTKLKMLDLSYMHNLRKIPQHLISRFSRLQIFRMWWSGCGDYPNEDNVLYGSNEKLMEELNGLQYLDILTIHKKARVV